jgi:long-chain acyl-CoA synthetase
MENYKYEDYLQVSDLKDLLSKVASKFRERDAFRFKTPEGIQSKTYEQFEKDVNALGTALLCEGFAGKKIALLGETSYEWVVSYFAVTCGVGVVVPIDKELPDGDIANIIADSGASAVIFSATFEETIKNIRAARIRYIPMYPCEADWTCPGIPELLRLGAKQILGGNTSFTEAKIDPDAMTSLIYTSGTTGKSKGIMLTHRSITSASSGGNALLQLGRVALSVLPIHHSFECTHGIIMFLQAGLTICINDSMRFFMQNLQLFKPDTICLVPLFLQNMHKKIWEMAAAKGITEQLKAAIAKSNELLSQGIDKRDEFFAEIQAAFGGNLKLIISGGAPLSADLMRSFREFGIMVLNGYGTSECSPLVSVNRNHYYKDGSVGLPIACCQVEIRDADEDGDGEVWVKGPNVMLGYYNNEQATRDVMADGWLNTGDIGHMDGDFLFLTGRSKNIIVLSNGKNVYPEEIEDRLLGGIPLIREVVVYAKHSGEGGETELAAEIYPNYDMAPDTGEEELTKILQKELAAVNKTLPLFQQVHHFSIRNTEFEKTTKKSIKRMNVGVKQS